MMSPVASLIDTLLASPDLSVEAAGKTMLRVLSSGEVTADSFREDPHILMESDYGVSRYLSQVTWRALNGDYEDLDELVAGLYGVLDRNPPTIETRSPVSSESIEAVVISEVRVIRVHQPQPAEDGHWDMEFDAQVTSGKLCEHEVRVRVQSSVNPTASRIVPYFWVHATVALYNLRCVARNQFEATSRTFFVLEPLRQVNATAVARSLLCPKPQIDQSRRGRSDVTIHTLKGMVVHAVLDLLIEGENDVEVAYAKVFRRYMVQLAAIADQTFDETGFQSEVLRHSYALKEFIDLNPHMREDPQVELRRYSATIGIQGRIDAVFRSGDHLDVVELKTGKRIWPEDHAQLFIYRLLLSDYVRREHKRGEVDFTLTARLLSSHDGTSTPLRKPTDFHTVLDARNRLLAHTYSLGRLRTRLQLPYPGYDPSVCDVCVSWTAKRCRKESAFFGDLPDSKESVELAYFKKFSTLVQREAWRAGKDLADLLDDSRIEFRMRNFRTIGGAKCIGRDSGAFVFAFEENNSDLGSGDRVLIHTGEISSTRSFHGNVRAISNENVQIFVPLNNISEDTFGEVSWTIDRFPSDYTAQSSQAGLYDFLQSKMNDRKRAVLGKLDGGATSEHSIYTENFSRSLNSAQSQAVIAAVKAPVFHLIWGPPGTGKTRVVSEIVVQLIAQEHVSNRGGVLLGAFTNTAVDKMLLSLIERDDGIQFIRIGRSKDSPELAARLGDRAPSYFSEDLAAMTGSALQLRRTLDNAPVIAVTAHRGSTHPYVRGRSFDMTVIDEASQLTEPLTLGLLMRGERFILVGDDRQLSPVVRSDQLSVSLFERLKTVAVKDAPERLTLLDVQYRMHPDIMEVCNRLYYGGVLSSGVTRGERASPVGRSLTFVPIKQVSEGRSNLAEAHAVHELVASLLRTVSPQGIGVISPFRAQVVLLRQLLNGTGVVVDTVERFQGGEREVIVLSLVRSHGSGFVFDDRRFNVAITRARRKLVVVGHPQIFRNTKLEWITEFADDP